MIADILGMIVLSSGWALAAWLAGERVEAALSAPRRIQLPAPRPGPTSGLWRPVQRHYTRTTRRP